MVAFSDGKSDSIPPEFIVDRPLAGAVGGGGHFLQML
jgi:hypothetical protein